MKTRFPQCRVSQWLDTSEISMNQAQATILYGVQTRRAPGGTWMHVAKGREPLIYKSQAMASAACNELRGALIRP